MANVPVRVSMTVKDEWGITASSALYALADDTKTVAATVTEANALVSAFDNTTDGQITSSRITLFPTLPGDVKAAALSGSRVEQTGHLGFSATGSSKRYSTSIPALSNDASVLVTDRMVLTISDPIGLLITILTTVGTVLKWCNEHYQEISKFLDALVSFIKKRKQLQRSSFQV